MWKSNVLAFNLPHFLGIPFFNGNLAPVQKIKVYCIKGCSYIEGEIVFFGKNRNHVCANFVRGIAISSNPVRSCYRHRNHSSLHEIAGHVIGYQYHRNIILIQLPAC